MRILTRPWFVAAVLGVAFALWALTVAPWAPWHERAVATVRLDLRAQTGQPHSAWSSPFQLDGSSTRVLISVNPAPGTDSLPAGFLGSVDWMIARGGEEKPVSGEWSGSQALSGPTPAAFSTSLPSESGGGDLLRLRGGGVAGSPVSIVVRVMQSRDAIGGLPVPLLLGILAVVMIGATATTRQARRRKPVVISPRHEHY